MAPLPVAMRPVLSISPSVLPTASCPRARTSAFVLYFRCSMIYPPILGVDPSVGFCYNNGEKTVKITKKWLIFSSKKCILKFKYITEWGVMKVSANSDIRVVELFAGVGGFRVGLERCSERFKTIWANQWEPGQAGQWAYKCYDKNLARIPLCECRYRHRDRPSAAARPSGGWLSLSGLLCCQHRC